LGLLHTMKNEIKLKKPNRLDFYGVRRPTAAPAHFEYITIPMHYNLEKSIVRWIADHLKGRYYVGRAIEIKSETRDMADVLKIGFEDAKELSYFTLACPHLKY
jgi:hypothetical protein